MVALNNKKSQKARVKSFSGNDKPYSQLQEKAAEKAKMVSLKLWELFVNTAAAESRKYSTT